MEPSSRERLDKVCRHEQGLDDQPSHELGIFESFRLDMVCQREQFFRLGSEQPDLQKKIRRKI